MTKRTLAPVLSALLDDLDDLAHGKKPHPKASKEGDRRVIAAARDELARMSGVVRAAERLPHADDCRAFGFDAAPHPCSCWKRALDRLRGGNGRSGR